MRAKRSSFAARVIRWQARSGRHDLPWQRSRDPYRVWLSEVMLQQTQVATVIGYFERFCERFPDVQALAAAPLTEVLSIWSGLGYYARARNLHACARVLVALHDGRFPRGAGQLAGLPGIGQSTAAAIAAFCFGERAPILDGNVRRVLARHFAIDGDLRNAAALRELRQLAASLLPASSDMPAYTQGLMDLGATVCTRRAPGCGTCPLASSCRALAEGRVDELPSAAPRRRTPLRTAWALLALYDDRVLLQARAPAGIWGGLLALPQFNALAAARRAAQALAPDARLQRLPQRQHAFTHFRLRLRPLRLELQRLPPTLREADQVWLRLAQIESAPLPAPIRALLREVRDRS